MFKYFRNASQLFLQEIFKENPILIRQIKRCQSILDEHNLGVIVTWLAILFKHGCFKDNVQALIVHS